MKKLLGILISVAIFTTISVTVFAEEVRPSVSISSPDHYIIKEGGSVRFTVSFDDAHEQEITFETEKVKPSFSYETLNVIKISKNVYDLIYDGVTSSGSIICEKGSGTTEDGSLTIETPHSISFEVISNESTRKDLADFILKKLSNVDNTSGTSIFADCGPEYNKLFDTGLMVGDGVKLNLTDKPTESEIYILNRRLEMYFSK